MPDDGVRTKQGEGPDTMRISCEGNFVADIRMSPLGFLAFEALGLGIRQAGHSLYDNDRKMFLVGTVTQLLGEG